jgi:DNA adenine methylase
MAPTIIGHFPPHRNYVELFGGSASVLMQKPRSEGEIYNDLSDDAWNLMRILQWPEAAVELERRLRLTPFSRREHELAYQDSEDPIERARRLIVRSFMGYGTAGATRGDRTGFRSMGFQQRVPSAIEWARYPDHIRTFTDRLQGVVLEHRPALELILGTDKPDILLYADPPYVHSTRTSEADTRKHYEHEMSDQDHTDLATALRQTSAMVIISGYRCELYDELYQGWERVDKSARSMMNVKRTESLWISPNARIPQGRLGL